MSLKRNELGQIIPVEINWEQFEQLCKIQCTQAEICAVLDVSEKTLTKHLEEHYKAPFQEVYKNYAEYGKASLRRIQMKMAEGNVAMAIWLGKQYLGQKDDALVNVSTFNQIWNSKLDKTENVSKTGRLKDIRASQ